MSFKPLIVNGKYLGPQPSALSPEEREISRDLQTQKRKEDGPSPDKRGKGMTETISYKNGDKEDFQRWAKDSYEYGSFGPTPPPPKPVNPNLQKSNIL
ncbi:hypothetical protein TrRE_jg2748 [Triparma retinervis]|jgi:hypothetical protein|uniref:Uncharacterized protein n=1 Tax=Triparma retinervis TaxID=2557542 RepID=A0A9W7CKQ0_9STRA|nr:hypothetical protein TrRE_jg2748 [Triparma retinervis]